MSACICVAKGIAARASLPEGQTSGRMQPFSLCYVKGHARMVTCLSVLAFCYTMEVSVLFVPQPATMHVIDATEPVVSC